MIASMLDERGFFRETPFSNRRVVVHPAHPSNYYAQRGPCVPIAIVWHEPQEPADDYESTPAYFASPNRGASTRWYTDNDGDLYQLVPINKGAIANGLDGKPLPRFNDGGPEFGPYSLNLQTDNNEVEGYTSTIAQTMTAAQWQACVDWAVLTHVMYGIPANVGRHLAHADLSVQRSDGVWIVRQSGIPQEAVKRVLKLEEQLKEIMGLAVRTQTRVDALEAQQRVTSELLVDLAEGQTARARRKLQTLSAFAGTPYPPPPRLPERS
jgi:hypothetical protein